MTNDRRIYNDFIFSDDFEIISELPENQYIVKAKYNRYYVHSYFPMTGSGVIPFHSSQHIETDIHKTEFTTQEGEMCLLSYNIEMNRRPYCISNGDKERVSFEGEKNRYRCELDVIPTNFWESNYFRCFYVGTGSL